jgi:membrane protease YdiL (CAAX protease family)
MNLRQVTRGSTTREIWVFLFLAYGLSWLLAIPGILIARGSTGSPFVILGAFGPAVAGMLLSYRHERDPQVRPSTRLAWLSLFWILCWAASYFGTFMVVPIRVTNQAKLIMAIVMAIMALVPAWILSGAFSRDRGVREFLHTLVCSSGWTWQIVALLSYALYVTGPALITKLWGGNVNQPRFAGEIQTVFPLAVGAFCIAFLFNGVSEEPGWRGYLLPRLQQSMSPLRASFGVWFLWALWHLPSDLTGLAGRTFEAYLGNRFGVLLPLTVILTWLYNRSGRSLMSTAVFHAAFNTFADFLPSVSGTTWLLYAWAAAVVVLDRIWEPPDLEPAPLTISTIVDDG